MDKEKERSKNTSKEARKRESKYFSSMSNRSSLFSDFQSQDAHAVEKWNKLRTKVLVEYILIIDYFLVIGCLGSFLLCLYTYYFEVNIYFNYRFTPITSLCLYLINVVAVLLLILNIIRKIFLYRLAQFRATTNILNQRLSLFVAELPLESFIIMINPVPWLMDSNSFGWTAITYYESEIVYMNNNILQLCAIFKLFIVLRAALARTIYYSDRAYRVCQVFGFELNYQFVIKCLMKHTPFAVSFSVLIVGVLIFGHAIRIAEKPLSYATDRMDHTSFFACVWESFITMSTVGFGDFVPRTNKGRMIMICCCLYGVLNFSLLVVSVTNFLQMGTKEEKSYILIKRVNLKRELKESGGEVLGKVAKFVFAKKTNKSDSEIKSKLNQLQSTFDRFDIKSQEYRESSSTLSFEDKLLSGFGQTNYNLDEVIAEAKALCQEMGIDPNEVIANEAKRVAASVRKGSSSKQ